MQLISASKWPRFVQVLPEHLWGTAAELLFPLMKGIFIWLGAGAAKETVTVSTDWQISAVGQRVQRMKMRKGLALEIYFEGQTFGIKFRFLVAFLSISLATDV